MKRCAKIRHLLGVCVLVLSLAGFSHSAVITDNEVVSLYRANSYGTGSGLGTLDIVLFAGATSNNSTYDGANTNMPGGAKLVDAYYITSIGDLRSFYTQQFINNGAVLNEMVILVDLNENVSKSANFDLLDIIVGNTDTYGDDRDNPSTTDIDSSLQNATSTVTGGSTIAEYATDSSFTTSKTTIENGSGWADYGILTGIDPFDLAYNDSDRIVFHVQFSSLTNGAEEIFLSGEYSAIDIINEEIPEPATICILMLGCGLIVATSRKR